MDESLPAFPESWPAIQKLSKILHPWNRAPDRAAAERVANEQGLQPHIAEWHALLVGFVWEACWLEANTTLCKLAEDFAWRKATHLVGWREAEILDPETIAVNAVQQTLKRAWSIKAHPVAYLKRTIMRMLKFEFIKLLPFYRNDGEELVRRGTARPAAPVPNAGAIRAARRYPRMSRDDRKARVAAVEKAVVTLTPRLKQVFGLQAQGLSSHEIREKLRITPGNLRKINGRILRHVKKMIEGEFEAGSTGECHAPDNQITEKY
jgi:DNA-directed RNA polymerase specialized sigma24 family protein